MVIYAEGDTKQQEDEAKEILGLLWNVYPGHPWAVKVGGGVVFIRHLGYGKNWGMNLRVTEADYDARVFKKKIIMLAGEWLERCHMKRGRFQDQEIEIVEGVPAKDQPYVH